MKVDELTINVNAKLKVDKLTAEGCAKLLSIYMNDTQGAALRSVQNTDGTIELVIEKTTNEKG